MIASTFASLPPWLVILAPGMVLAGLVAFGLASVLTGALRLSEVRTALKRLKPGRRATTPHLSHPLPPPQAHRGGLHEHATNAFAMLDAIAARLGQNRASGPPPEVGETPSTAAVAASEGISILGSQMEGIAA